MACGWPFRTTYGIERVWSWRKFRFIDEEVMYVWL
jgi:hypothetical protein